MPKKIISKQPVKGAFDWPPEEFRVRQLIFDTWRKVCLSYGYEEYLTPLVESAELYRAKSGEDVGGKELATFTDRGGRQLAIRPEMTPSVTRLVSKTYRTALKPIRYFSIANFMRNEKPQRGRNREFWQLNFDIFGSNALEADIEIAQIALDIILSFKPPKDSFVLYVNNRRLIDEVLDKIVGIPAKNKVQAVRVLDKWEKLGRQEFGARLGKLGLGADQINKLAAFMKSTTGGELIKNLPELAKSQGLKEVNKITSALAKLGFSDWIEFRPNVIRGFDYYDGPIFEVFDNHPDNNRSMFGGGRYNGLAELFGKESFPATGAAPGDETIRLFLESWKLEEKLLSNRKVARIYLPILAEELRGQAGELARRTRQQGKQLELGLEVQKISKALQYADKRGAAEVIILGPAEQKKGIYKIKDMASGKERKVKVAL